MDERIPPTPHPDSSPSDASHEPPIDPYNWTEAMGKGKAAWTDQMAVHSAARLLRALTPEDADVTLAEMMHRERLEGVASQQAVISQLKEDMGFDTRTGLLTENKFKEAIREKIEKEPDAPWGIIYIDLKDFKWINDKHPEGYDKGDQVLEEVGELLHRSSRHHNGHNDFLMQRNSNEEGRDAARLHGDEFTMFVDLSKAAEGVLLPEDTYETDERRIREDSPNGRLASICSRLERIAQSYRQANPDLPYIDFTIGSAIYEKGMTVEEVMTLAEKDMKRHKREQKQQYGSYRTTPDPLESKD